MIGISTDQLWDRSDCGGDIEVGTASMPFSTMIASSVGRGIDCGSIDDKGGTAEGD